MCISPSSPDRRDWLGVSVQDPECNGAKELLPAPSNSARRDVRQGGGQLPKRGRCRDGNPCRIGSVGKHLLDHDPKARKHEICIRWQGGVHGVQPRAAGRPLLMRPLLFFLFCFFPASYWSCGCARGPRAFGLKRCSDATSQRALLFGQVGW